MSVNYVEGKSGKVIALRLLPGMDVMASITEACEQANIKNGAIKSMIGSLRNAQFYNPEPNEKARMGYAYGAPIILTGAIELVCGAGMISHGDNGEVLLHVHVCLSDVTGKAYGGHLIPGNEVLMTVDMLIEEIIGINMIRRFDEQTGIPMFKPEAF